MSSLEPKAPPTAGCISVSRLCFELTETGVEGQDQCQMVGLWWGSLFENSPEPGDPVAGFAPQHPLGAEVDGGVWV